MDSDIKDLPPGSQPSTSELSDPPDFSDEEMREITVNMTPVTRRQSGYTPTKNQPETDGNEASIKASGDMESVSNDDEIEAEIHVSPIVTRRKVPSKRSQLHNSKSITSRQPAAKRVKTNTKKWEPNYVTQNSRSPLVSRDLRALLLLPQAWDVLTDEDKKEVLALFPDEKHILEAGTPNARPDILSLQNDDNFRHDTEEYVSNLSRDMHDPTWLQDAWAAHGSRAAGSFDQFYIRRLEADWKTTIPDEMKPEHLRSAPKPESSMVDGQLVEADAAAGDQETGNHEADSDEVGNNEAENNGVDELEVGDTIVASGMNGSADMEDVIKVNEKPQDEEISAHVSNSNAENDLPEIVMDGLEKTSDAIDDETNNDNSDKMQTGP
ncbi:hypothetical protein VP1G_00090 [Cytospora mali]|uniref:ASX DEUBAD domain-containing protein n=1 Tax=Cytospora mali TaxID=578113 RepID=A0A194ULY4_CYTMA|nr:hypothetical protein VP1G_00090 [Valsa mali var. pyri (nom. inval.)]